jgi:hypothetical protein
MSTEYWYPTPICYFDLQKDETIIIYNEINNILDSNSLLFYKNAWADFLTITQNLNKFKNFNLINTFKIFTFYITNFLNEVNYHCKFEIKDTWLNFLFPKGFQNKHNHTELTPKDLSLCSAVYYYDINTQKNEFEGVTFDLSSNLNFYNVRKNVSYEYIPGRLIIFSSTIPHFVNFNKTEKTRSSLSFNVKELND